MEWQKYKYPTLWLEHHNLRKEIFKSLSPEKKQFDFML